MRVKQIGWREWLAVVAAPSWRDGDVEFDGSEELLARMTATCAWHTSDARCAMVTLTMQRGKQGAVAQQNEATFSCTDWAEHTRGGGGPAGLRGQLGAVRGAEPGLPAAGTEAGLAHA